MLKASPMLPLFSTEPQTTIHLSQLVFLQAVLELERTVSRLSSRRPCSAELLERNSQSPISVLLSWQKGLRFFSDACYHRACDTIDNLAKDAFIVNTHAVARVVAKLIDSTDILQSTSTSSKRASDNSVGLVNLGKACHEHEEM